MKAWNTLTEEERSTAYRDASLRINDIEWYRFHGIDPRPTASCGTSYWQSTLTANDVTHLRSLGFRGAAISGNPYRLHLKKDGEPAALCGAQPGRGGRGRKMVNRAGWNIYSIFESPGRETCKVCLEAVERLDTTTGASAS